MATRGFRATAQLLFLNNSANEETGEIASESNQVHVHYDGRCVWEPFFTWTVSRCAVDSTWFPFDEQHCHIIYSSWKYSADRVFLTTNEEGDDNKTPGMTLEFRPDGIWDITG